jgi:hypothetical protein
VSLAFLGAVSIASAADATPTGFSGASGQSRPGCEVNMADNSANSWFGYYLEPQTKSALSWGLSYIENETNIDEVAVSTRTDLTDAIYNDGDYSTLSGPPCVRNDWWPRGHIIGATVCWSLTSSRRCEQHRIYVSTAWEYEPTKTAGWDRALLLHESGHGLGLTHSSQSSTEVMSPLVPEVDSYSAHDKFLIDSHY